jgi:hypothetical protein
MGIWAFFQQSAQTNNKQASQNGRCHTMSMYQMTQILFSPSRLFHFLPTSGFFYGNSWGFTKTSCLLSSYQFPQVPINSMRRGELYEIRPS